MRVVVIDDDAIDQYIFKTTFENVFNEVEVKYIQDPSDYLSRLENNVDTDIWPDVLFVDINMPVLSGFDFVQRFSNLSSAKEAKVFMLSSSVDPQEKQKAINTAIISDYIEKPITVSKLKATMS